MTTLREGVAEDARKLADENGGRALSFTSLVMLLMSAYDKGVEDGIETSAVDRETTWDDYMSANEVTWDKE